MLQALIVPFPSQRNEGTCSFGQSAKVISTHIPSKVTIMFVRKWNMQR